MSVCRGCAGTGVSQQVTPREAQIAGRSYTVMPDHQRGGGLPRVLKLGPAERHRNDGHIHITAPLIEMIATVDELDRDGFHVDDVPFQRGWACEWCHGTGQPQLSVQYLQMAARA